MTLCSWFVLLMLPLEPFRLHSLALPLPRSGLYQIHGASAKDGEQLRQFKIEKPNFVVNGAHLSKVEVWSWPTGTGITQPTLVGEATLTTAPGGHERWVLRIPPDLLCTEIFAIAFDSAGKKIGKKTLAYKGATALYEALYEKK